VKHVSFNLMFDWLTMLKQLTVAPERLTAFWPNELRIP
jgi:hypothetical protein